MLAEKLVHDAIHCIVFGFDATDLKVVLLDQTDVQEDQPIFRIDWYLLLLINRLELVFEHLLNPLLL